jgi:5-formyltetrahydrofolate cyclo-ligase
MAKTPVADEKKYLRAILTGTRESLTASFAKALSSRVQSAFLHSDFYRKSQAPAAIVLYSALANEVSADDILSDALAAGRSVFFPRLDRARDVLSLCKVESRSDLAPGAYGILEPQTPAIDIRSLPPCVMVVPGVAFTILGERMGRGGGHYDRLLAEIPPHAITVGLAYSFQLLDNVPQSGCDRRLNFVVTESAIYPAPDTVWRESGIRAQGGNPR